jgi:hypothetical protein
MAVLKGAAGSSNPEFKKIPDCEINHEPSIGAPFPCSTMATWVVVNEETKERKLCCNKHLTKALNKEYTYRIYSTSKLVH